MKGNLKYIILIIFFGGCKGKTPDINNDNQSLYAEPVTISLDTNAGYSVNIFSGDSIKSLRNSLGDIVKTGVPVPFIDEELKQEGHLKSTTIQGVQTVETIIPDNVYPVPDKLSVTSIDTSLLKKIKLGEGDQSFVLRNDYGTVTTGVPIPVTGKKMPFSEPHPVRAGPMRFKDNATTSIQYLDVEQGLSYSFIDGIYEDKRGNLWFGIDRMGISKYDGINITTYSEKEGLSNNFVRSIIEDRNNNLWIGTLGGVTCFDGKNFTQYTEKEGLPANEVLSISEDRKGNIWICTIRGLTKYDGKYFTNFTRKEGLPADTILSCLEDRKGDLWIGTYKGVAKYDGNSFTYYTSQDGLGGDVVSSLLEDKDGNIWFSSLNEGLTMFNGKQFTHFTKKEGLSDNAIWSMAEDNHGNIWISTAGGGLNKYDGTSFTHYGIEQGLSNIKVRSIGRDRSGNLWLATEGGGVNKINATNFNYRIPEELVENNRIRPILNDKEGNMWFGTEAANIGKLSRVHLNAKEKLFTYYKVLDKFFWKGERTLVQDKNGNIWIGTTGSGIVKYDGKQFTNFSLDADPARQAVYDILEDKKGNIWFGENNGHITSYDGKNFIRHTIRDGLPGTIIYSMLEGRNGNIWFCTEGAGVYKYDGSNLINYTEQQGLFSKSVTSIAEDNRGNIWLGTLGAGACRFDGKNFTYYTEKQGLSNNNVWSVFCDPLQQLWFGTDKGLSLFVPKNVKPESNETAYSLYKFTSQDGLKAIDFNLHSVCLDDNNHIWWGTGKGVVSIDMAKKFNADSIHSPTLNHIEINDRFFDYRNLPEGYKNNISYSDVIPFSNCPDKLSVSHNLNHLSFHFSAIDWSAPDKIKYSYRLVGLGEQWSKASEDASVDYRNLNHGKYQFQVKAIGQSQVWTEPLTYDFTIRPAWWQTWWFKTLITAVALTLIFLIGRFIYYYQLRKQRVALEKQLAVQYERQRISTEMHDDIGAGLSGIRLLTEMTKNKVKDKQAAEDVDKIYQSVGDISSKMKEVIWSLNSEHDSLSNLLSYIQKQSRLWLEHYPCQLTVELPDTIPPIDINGETRRNVLLVVKEAIHNIIKHSGANKIDVKMSCYDGRLIITVSDNGKGTMDEQINGSGNGMKNMRQRIEKLNGKLFIKNQEGLTLTFEIPFQSPL